MELIPTVYNIRLFDLEIILVTHLTLISFGTKSINDFLALLFQDPETFVNAFRYVGMTQGGTQLRFNFYPCVKDQSQVKPNQIRCGEHTDYGGITLLFQDEAGGLEVCGVYVYIIVYVPSQSNV